MPREINEESLTEADHELNTTLESAPLPPGWEERQVTNEFFYNFIVAGDIFVFYYFC